MPSTIDRYFFAHILSFKATRSLTLLPFAFLAIWTKGFVVPLIIAATVVLGNMMMVNSELGELFLWVSSFFY